MAFCLANAFTYSVIFNSQFCFYTNGILEGFFGFYERRTCNSRISKGLYDAVINCLGQQQAYESSRRNLMHFLIKQTRVVVGERVGSLQVFLWILHTPYAIYAALNGNFLVCSIRLDDLFQLFLDKAVPSCSNNLKYLKLQHSLFSLFRNSLTTSSLCFFR